MAESSNESTIIDEEILRLLRANVASREIPDRLEHKPKSRKKLKRRILRLQSGLESVGDGRVMAKAEGHCQSLFDAPSQAAGNEIKALKLLTSADCKHAPRYLCDFKRSYDGGMYSTEYFVIMTELPGTSLYDLRGMLGALNEDAQAKKEVIREAFTKAVEAVHACGVDNGSHHNANILWDDVTQQCFIIDFERAECGPCSDWEELESWL